jgi:hypothetical protein
MTTTSTFAALALAQALSVDPPDRPVDPLRSPDARLVVLVFVQTDCPLSNRYAPEVQRLQEKFSPQGVAFWLVYPDASETADAVRRHLEDYGYRTSAARDPGHVLVRKAKARVTPEAAVFAPGERLVYHGRIDDRYPELGRARAKASSHDLEAALEAALAGRPLPTEGAPAVGCFIADLE